jgi:hypothetical protein
MRQKFVLLILLTMPLSSGCAFYEKRFVSEIVLEGRNYRPKIYDEGAFYINGDPTVRMRMGCSARTIMIATMAPLIPFPFGKETKPHESIADRKFSLTLWHYRQDNLDFSELQLQVAIDSRIYPLQAVRKEQEQYSLMWEYQFEADLPCGEVQEGQLRIQLNQETVRAYGVQFEEGIQREVAWQPYFVT